MQTAINPRRVHFAKILEIKPEPIMGLVPGPDGEMVEEVVDPGDLNNLVSPTQTILITLEGEAEPVKQPAYWLRTNHPVAGDMYVVDQDGVPTTMKGDEFPYHYTVEP